MARFGLVGAAGYIAPRHLQAIKDVDGTLIAALDPHDSVGVLDRYFADTRFFTEFERFDRHLEKIRRKGDGIDYLSICSPNFLHDAHVRTAMRVDADAICEKPLVINPWNLDQLAELERETQKRVFCILQLRVHPGIKKIKAHASTMNRPHIELQYITKRGPWYQVSWKGDSAKSGGVIMNIGIHFFDMLIWLFGSVESSRVLLREADKAKGIINLKNADVSWFLSTDGDDRPKSCIDSGQPAFRSIAIDGEEIEFSGNFNDLHTVIYQQTLAGQGYGIEDCRPSIELVHQIRNCLVQSSNRVAS